MKQLKFWFVYIMTLITVLIVFLIADVVFAGLVYYIICIWSKVIALKVFGWIVFCMFFLQALFSIPCTFKVIKEGDEESGT